MALPPRFRAMQERYDAATDGPWAAYEVERWAEYEVRRWRANGSKHAICVGNSSYPLEAVDCEFIAHSRTDVPDLLWSLGVALKALGIYEGDRQIGTEARKAIALIERGRDGT